MGKVLTNVFKDEVAIYPSGAQRSVDIQSAVLGIRTIPLADYPVGGGVDPIPQKSCLLVRDPVLGNIYIGETLDTWAAKVGNSGASPDRTTKYNWLVGTDVPAGNIILDARLYNLAIISVNKGGNTVYGVPYNPDAGSSKGRLDFTDFGRLSVGETVQIIYNNI